MNLQEHINRIKEVMELITESDPKVGTGKKPEGSGRRLYTDENPNDTVSVKFRTKEDIVDTLNKESFKSKPHKIVLSCQIDAEFLHLTLPDQAFFA